MNNVPEFLENLFDEQGISIIDTDKQGRPQTSLQYTLELIFKCMNEYDFNYTISERQLKYLIDAMGQEDPSLELNHKSRAYEILKQAYKDYGKEKIRVQQGSKSMKDFMIFSNPSTKDAIAVSIWDTYQERTEEGEVVIKCEERSKIEDVKYHKGESPIGTYWDGRIPEGGSFASVISLVYKNIIDEEQPMSHRVAIALLDQIPVEGGNEKGYRPSQRILDLYRPGVVVVPFGGKKQSDKNRLVFSYLGNEVVVIDTMWDKKRDGTIHSHSGNSMVLTNLEGLEKLRSGEKMFIQMPKRKYHINEPKLKQSINQHLRYTTKGYGWYLTHKRAEFYIKIMESLLETNADGIYKKDYSMNPENKRDGEIEAWISKQKHSYRNNAMSNYRKAIIELKFLDYSYEKIRFAWNCKCIRRYMQEYNGKYPTASTNPKLSVFIANSGKIINRIAGKIQSGTELTEIEQFEFQQLMQIGIIDKLCERTKSLTELYTAMGEYFNQIEKSKVARRMKEQGE